MKKPQIIYAGVVLIVGLIFILHAQEEATPVAGGTDSASDWSSASDLQVMLEAVEQTPAMSATAAPQAGTFWSAQHAPGSLEPWPPMPTNIRGVQLWPLGDNIYLLDDLTINYDQPVKSKTTAKTAGEMEAMDEDDGPLSPPGGDTNDDGGYTNNFQITPIDTNGLWLQITNVSNGLAYLNLMNATDLVYEIWSKTNLLDAGWNIEGELWPTNSQTNVMPFTVTANSPTNLFIWARDWTGITSGGNETPEWWFWNYFGTTNLSDINLDSTGENTLLYDYTNHLDPNVIEFSLQFTNNYVNASPVHGGIAIVGGVPSYEAILINDTNQADADWEPYTSTNVMVSLNWGNGLYNVLVGLKGLPGNATPTWLGTWLTLNAVAPVLTVTNPTSSTVSVPMIQLQGLVNESLSSLTYDVSNAAGVFTNQTGYCQPVFYDTNLLTFTTNSFQCYDVQLTNGLNTITLHAMDAAGNTTTTNVSYTLDYSGDHTAPALNILWPTNGTYISGSNFTLQAQMDDATATVTASIVDTNGDTNIIQGLVERSGKVWLDGVPLSAGTNLLTLTATDGAGNSTTTNLTLVQSGVMVTMDPLSNDQFNQSSVNVTGTINDPNSAYDIYVNGVEAYYTDDIGDWEADNVPVSAIGTATFDVEIYVGDPVNVGSQIFSMAQAAQVVIASYEKSYAANGTYPGWCGSSGPNVFTDGTEHWISGDGSDHEFGTVWDGQCGYPPSDYDTTTDLSAYTNNLPVTWENASESEGDGYGTAMTSIKTTVNILPSGQQAIGQTALYLVMAQVINKDTGLQLAAGAVRFMNQLAGTATEDVTNDDGSVWSQAIVVAASGAPAEATPISAGNISFNGMLVSNVTLKIFAATNGTAIDLSTNTPEFCVGQQVTFSNCFDPPITNMVVSNSYNWTYTSMYVNHSSQASTNASVNYDISEDLLNVATPTNWWVTGGTKNAYLHETFYLNNGKSVTLAASGQFTIYQPQTTVTTTTGTVAVDGNDVFFILTPISLHYGIPDETPGITFHNNTIITNGEIKWLQVINYTYTSLQNNDGSWTYAPVITNALDNTNSYGSYTNDINATADSPGFGPSYPDNFQTISESSGYNMWLEFKPTNGIWVPLRVVSWSWTGTGVRSGTNWVLTSNPTPDPNPSDSDTTTFPSWSNIATNSAP